jgi:histidine triad (HIT) family protein
MENVFWLEQSGNRNKASQGTKSMECTFCKIVSGELPARIVFSDDVSMAFLDQRPIFPGHCLLIPKVHVETIEDIQPDLAGPFFYNAKRLAIAVRKGVGAQGTFMGINNIVSQSVPHLHMHIVPRRPKDGLRGFFWPRQKYESEEQAVRIQEAIKQELTTLLK